MSATTHRGPQANEQPTHLDEPHLRRVLALAIAHARGPAAQLHPDDDDAAAAALTALRQLGVVLTPASRHAVHAALLHTVATTLPGHLDLWQPQQITVANWLRELALDEEHEAGLAEHHGADPIAVPRRLPV
jgi:hypothetical protein